MSWLIPYYGFWGLPASLWLLNEVLPSRIRWYLLWPIAIFSCYAVLLLAVHMFNRQLQAELNKHDLNGDGAFSGQEITPDMELALGRVTSDTARAFAPITGIPLSIIWVAINYIPFTVASLAIWLIRAHRIDFFKKMPLRSFITIPRELLVTTIIHIDYLENRPE